MVAIDDVFLIPLITGFVMQTSVGNSFYQGMQKTGWVFLIMAVAALSVQSLPLFYMLADDLVLGATIGITINLILLPTGKPDVAFRKQMIPVIKILNDYFSKTLDQLLQSEKPEWNNAELEKALLQFPEWVHERGFNSALQPGYQFFLTQAEKMSDVLLSMHHLARFHYDLELIAKIRPALLQCADSITLFFEAIVTALELKKLTEEPMDPENFIATLQKQFFAMAPANMELFDMQRDYGYLGAFIYDLKTLRDFLVKMGEALR